MEDIWRDLRVAYSGYSKWIGIAFAGVSIFSWAAKALGLPLSAFVEQFVAAYRAAFHPIVQFLLGWTLNFLAIELPPWWPDVVIVYCVIGGAVARTSWTYHQGTDDGTPLEFFGGTKGRVVGPVVRSVLIAGSFAFWPIAVFQLLMNPHVYVVTLRRSGARHRIPAPEHPPVSEKVVHVASSPIATASLLREATYLYDLRVVFLLQLAAALMVCIAIVMLNIITVT